MESRQQERKIRIFVRNKLKTKNAEFMYKSLGMLSNKTEFGKVERAESRQRWHSRVLPDLDNAFHKLLNKEEEKEEEVILRSFVNIRFRLRFPTEYSHHCGKEVLTVRQKQ
jgi:hypothetical protein